MSDTSDLPRGRLSLDSCHDVAIHVAGQRQSTAGQRWRLTAVNGGRPLLTTAEPPVNGRSWAGSGLVIQIVLWIVNIGCSKHMNGNLKLLRNFVEKFIGTVHFGNENFATITGYGDYIQGNLNLEVAFRSNTCYIRNLEGEDLLTGSRNSNLYTISISKMVASSPVCLMSKASSTKSWPMRVENVNQKRYILLIVDDYSRYTYVYFLRTKYETPDTIINFITQIQKNMKAQVLKVRTDNGIGSKNVTLKSFYEKQGIMHHMSIARTPQQNGVVERRNRTLVEAARTMLLFSKLPKFLWVEAFSTACFTQNRSFIHTRYNKTPNGLNKGRKPNIQYFHVSGSLCYPTNDRDDLGKMRRKADIAIFVGYSESSMGFHIYNRRTRKIMESIHVKFNELTAMASEYNNSGPEPSTPILNTHSDEKIQEDNAKLDGNTLMNLFRTLDFEEAESSLNYQDPLNMHEFNQKHRHTDKWTKNHPIEQVIGDPSKHVTTRSKLQTNAELCMYALTMSLTEPKNIKEAMLDHSWIESMQDELNQFKRLDVWELISLSDADMQLRIFINQSQYTLELLRKHGMEKCDIVTTPMATAKIDANLQGTLTDQTKYCNMIGGLMYLIASQPNIAFATFICARYQARPTETHLKEVKIIFRYLRQTYNLGLWYSKDSGFELITYLDADLARCLNDYKSTSGGIQFLEDKLVSWSFKKQDCTVMSTAEAEYVSLSACCAQVIWITTQLLDYGYRYNKIPLYCDSKSAIAISCNPLRHSCTKHINIRYHFIKKHVEKGTIELYFVRMEYQLADLFTKALPRERFEYLFHRFGMQCMTPTQLERLAKLSY
ncbi:retrovirus-related pol polyprotein from transposon TNT 1-94 [Tanacetum coccineum]